MLNAGGKVRSGGVGREKDKDWMQEVERFSKGVNVLSFCPLLNALNCS